MSDAAGAATVESLLLHTSGLPDYTEHPSLAAAFQDPDHEWREGELLEAVEAPEEAGSFAYSNTNYTLLGSIIARAAETPVEVAFEQLVIEPLGLASTFLARDDTLLPRWAHGYDTDEDPPADRFAGAAGIPTSIWHPLFTDGGIASTATDVATFTDALHMGRLVSDDTLETMSQPGPDGDTGMGIYELAHDDVTYWGHDGSFDGFSSAAFCDRDAGVTIVVLANDDDSATGIWGALASAYADASS